MLLKKIISLFMTDSIMDADSTAITGGVTAATPPAISIQNAYKRYSATNIVLHGLNLTVPDKSIYALLGPSGCGKTTLLNCIVGKTELDSGAIKLNVKRRMDIGHMPQSLSLYDQMTIDENFYFYGLLYHMSDTEIRKRSDELLSFLELPSGGRFVASLSGGQQRRVSIAVALIHDPKIIILDEPTVGLDPILNHSIWNRLLEMANRGKSIVITTHYIQEARQAHTIGLMREGKLLAEEPPLQLMEKHCCSDLEAAFLKLSHKQDAGMRQQAGPEEYPEKTKKVKAYYEDDERMFSLDKFTGVMYKNVTFLRRENVFLAFLIILPILQSYLFNVAIGGKPKHMNLAVINEEMPFADCSPSRYNGCILSEEDIYNENITLSCMFLDYLKNATYNFIEYKNDSEALDAVRKNEVWALLHFTHNYSVSLAYRISYGASIHEEDLESGIVNTWIDLSNKYIGSLVKLDIAQTMYALLRRILSDCSLNPKLGSIPIQFEKPIFGSFNGSFLGYASNAMLCLTCFFLPMILSAGLMLTEKIGGMMERMMVAGVTITEIILSATIIQIVVHCIQTTLVMMVIYWWFDNPLEGSIVTLSFLLLLTGICGMFFGLAVAISNSDMMRSSYIGIGINLALCFTTGLLWPIDAAHYILRVISPLVPLTHTVDAVRAICAKNLSFFHPLVLRGFASTTVWMLIVFVIMCLFIRYKRDGLTVHN